MSWAAGPCLTAWSDSPTSDDVSARIPVTFAPGGLTCWVEPGSTLLDAARLAGIIVPAPCGGRGICGSCGVRVLSGDLAPADGEEQRGLARAPKGVRLACRARVIGPVEIRPLIAHVPVVGVPGRVGPGAVVVAGVDLGTTSVAALVVDAVSGRELARAAVANRQQSYGADVISRIGASLEGAAANLAAAAEASVLDALTAATSAAGVGLDAVERLVVVGNSAMSALLVRADVTSLAAHPFSAPRTPAELDSAMIRDALAPGAQALLLRPIAGFVGGDALAALVSAGMCDATAPTLLVDIGTNAEILLAGAGPLCVASAAAGPAFEGVGIACGGPAAEGAVDRVRVGEDGELELSVLGRGPARWLSGSGLVSAVAELRRHRHLDAEGRMHPEGPLAERFKTSEAGVVEVALTGGDGGGSIVLTQLDVRALQLAKAAVRVGIESVLRSANLPPSQLADVLIAGAFGSALEPGDLSDLGVVPAVTRQRVRRVGNAALDGAATIALDPGLLACAEEAAACAVHVDLASAPGFSAELMAATTLAAY